MINIFSKRIQRCISVILFAALAFSLTGCSRIEPVTGSDPVTNPHSQSPAVEAPAPSGHFVEAGNSPALTLVSAKPIDTFKYPDSESYYNPDTFNYDTEAYEKDQSTYFENVTAWKAGWQGAQFPGGFTGKLLPLFLSSDQNKNPIIAPVNIYLAMAMLSEISAGNTRSELLKLLDSSNITSLRKNAALLMNACSYDDGMISVRPGASVWMRSDSSYNPDTLQILADNYRASSFSGVFGSDEYTKLLQDWLNEQTGGLLSDQASGISPARDTFLALCETIWFKAQWAQKFSKAQTAPGIFHKTGSDITCDFMNETETNTLYSGAKYTAASKRFNNGGSMTFILPDDGYSVNDLLTDKEVQAFIDDVNNASGHMSVKMHLSLPKFDISSNMDLINGLKALGVSEAFDADRSDFSSITDRNDIFVSDILHAARIKVDEDGCEAAAYTVIMMKETAFISDERKVYDFILDKPFLVVIRSNSDLPLFVGVVNNPVE